MGPATDGMVLGVLAVCLAAAIVALTISLLVLSGLRRGVRRVGAQVNELRQHPLVGAIPPERTLILESLGCELNELLAGLRTLVRREHDRAVELQAFADGPSRIALISLDLDWQVTSFNRGAVNLTGWPAEEIIDHHVEVLFAPGAWEKLLPKLARRSLRDAGIVDRVLLQRRDGGRFVSQVSVETGGGPGREETSLLLVARDLTDEDELERRLRGSEERYRRLVEEMGDRALIIRAGQIVFANPAVAGLLGVDRDVLKGLPFKEIVHTRDLLRVLEQVRRAEAGEEIGAAVHCRLSVSGGSPIEARMAWTTTDFEGGRAILSTVVDLTERARFEKLVADSEARLRATLDSTGDGILVIGESPRGHTVTVVNRPFCELFGRGADSLLGLPEPEVWRLLEEHCAEPDAMRALRDSTRESQQVRRESLEITSPHRAVIDVVAGPVCAADGHSLGLILTMREVTDRVDGERRLKESFEEISLAKSRLETTYRDLAEAQRTLADRNRQLEELNTELRSLDEMKSNLLANVSHELHTPLVSIKGYTEMIVKRKLGPLTPEQERGLSVALKNIDRLIEMIDNLLSFARMERGETQLSLEDIPLWLLIDEAIEMAGERIRKRGLTVTTQYESEGLVVRGDRGKLGQVLTNLLTNAVKFNRDGGRIAISARRGPEGFAEVRVADTGIGIPAGEQQRIFERFYQAESGPGRRYEGTGIGLSIVRDFLRLHGCSIRVESAPEKGSVFSFTLPLARVPEPSETRPPGARGRSND